MVFGMWLPYSPVASALGFAPLPGLCWPILLLTLLGYMGLAQSRKSGCCERNGSRHEYLNLHGATYGILAGVATNSLSKVAISTLIGRGWFAVGVTIACIGSTIAGG